MSFGLAPRFEFRPDGTIVARAGTQTNCGGIALLHIRISPNPSNALTFGPDFDPAWEGDRYGGEVPGRAIPDHYRQAAFKGALDAFNAFDTVSGAHFEILDALVHAVDANLWKFREAGYRAMEGWLQSRGFRQMNAEDDEP
ncbi:MAG TPA: hypothetical protein VIM99_16370 [Blastocatellia bacterium]